MIQEIPLVVIDTDVLVSGLLKPYSAPAKVLRLVVGGYVRLLYDVRILTEYREVLLRPKFGSKASYVDAILEYFVTEGISVTAQPLGSVLPDPEDIPFLEVAISGKADALVTGNKAHFPSCCPGAQKIYSPSEF